MAPIDTSNERLERKYHTKRMMILADAAADYCRYAGQSQHRSTICEAARLPHWWTTAHECHKYSDPASKALDPIQRWLLELCVRASAADKPLSRALANAARPSENLKAKRHW